MYYRRLKDLREDCDKSQKDIAQILGIDQRVYSNYERGVRAIPLKHLVALADYYDVSIDYIVERTTNKKRA